MRAVDWTKTTNDLSARVPVTVLDNMAAFADSDEHADEIYPQNLARFHSHLDSPFVPVPDAGRGRVVSVEFSSSFLPYDQSYAQLQAVFESAPSVKLMWYGPPDLPLPQSDTARWNENLRFNVFVPADEDSIQFRFTVCARTASIF